ncbi:MAG TPA: hypothetical protein VFW44_04810 [Bryobacteraceae bacterium]|nr:hypothetical protein [Bryobacteraceae bacterium]
MPCSQVQPPAGEQNDGWVEDLAQPRRIGGVRDRNQHRARFEHFLLLLDGVLESAAAGDGLGDAARKASRFEFVPRRAKNLVWRTVLGDELPGLAHPEAGDQVQGEPVELVFLCNGGGGHRCLPCGAGRRGNFSAG